MVNRNGDVVSAQVSVIGPVNLDGAATSEKIPPFASRTTEKLR